MEEAEEDLDLVLVEGEEGDGKRLLLLVLEFIAGEWAEGERGMELEEILKKM